MDKRTDFSYEIPYTKAADRFLKAHEKDVSVRQQIKKLTSDGRIGTVRNIILTFLTPEINVNHAQLILTSHDVWQFSNELLCRDELRVADKNWDGGIPALKPLVMLGRIGKFQMLSFWL